MEYDSPTYVSVWTSEEKNDIIITVIAIILDHRHLTTAMRQFYGKVSRYFPDAFLDDNDFTVKLDPDYDWIVPPVSFVPPDVYRGTNGPMMVMCRGKSFNTKIGPVHEAIEHK